MARKARKGTSEPAEFKNTQRYYLEAEAAWGGFINARLSEETAEAFQKWLVTDEGRKYALLVDDMVGQGIKVTFSFDQEHNCYVASATGALCSETPKHRYSSTSRAGSIAEVLAMTAWKHFYLVEGDYSAFRPSRTGNGLAWG